MEENEKKESSKETTKDKPFTECPFENGKTKVYLSLECLVDLEHNSRQLTQVGCLNGKTGETMYTCMLPSPQVVEFSTKKMLKLLPWINVKCSETNLKDQPDKAPPSSNKTVTANIRSAPKEVCVSQSEGLAAVLKFIRAAKTDDSTEVALVVYTKQELHELVLALKEETKGDSSKSESAKGDSSNVNSSKEAGDNSLFSELRSLVSSVGVYENHLSSKVGRKPLLLEPLQLRSSKDKENLEDMSLPASRLVHLLRERFVKEGETEAFYSLTPLTEKLPESCLSPSSVNQPRSKSAKFLLISPVHISFSKRDYIYGAPKKTDESGVVEEEVVVVNPGDPNCVTAFKVGLFGFHQPVVLKFKDIDDSTNTVEYSAEVVGGYKGEGVTKLHDYNSVKFAIVNLELAKTPFIRPQDPNVDFKLKHSMKVLPEDSRLVNFNQKSQVLGPEQMEETVKVELFYNSQDPTNVINLSQARPVSILVDLVTTSSKQFSMSDVFMLTPAAASKTKNLSVVNKLFCVLEDKSTLARLVLLPECKTNLTPGQSVGHAVLVNKQNFGEALVAAFLADIEVNAILAHRRQAEARDRDERRQEARYDRRQEAHDRDRRSDERDTDNRRGKFVRVRGKHGEGPGRPFKRFKNDEDDDWKNSTRRQSQYDHRRKRGSYRENFNDSRRDGRGDLDSYPREDPFSQPRQDFPGPDDSDLFTRRDDLRHSVDFRRDNDRSSRIPHRDGHRNSGYEDSRSYHQYNPPSKSYYR